MAGKSSKDVTTRDAEIDRLKEEYVWYFKQLPVQRLAAKFIGRNEDTIIRWKKADPAFAEQVSMAESEWARTKAAKVRPEFLLERIMKETFSPPKQEVEVTIPTSISFHYHAPDDKLSPDNQTTSGVAGTPEPAQD